MILCIAAEGVGAVGSHLRLGFACEDTEQSALRIIHGLSGCDQQKIGRPSARRAKYATISGLARRTSGRHPRK